MDMEAFAQVKNWTHVYKISIKDSPLLADGTRSHLLLRMKRTGVVHEDLWTDEAFVVGPQD